MSEAKVTQCSVQLFLPVNEETERKRERERERGDGEEHSDEKAEQLDGGSAEVDGGAAPGS